MPLVSHLYGLPGISGSVGRAGVNNPADVKSIKALLNPYLRASGQGASAIDVTAAPSLSTAIETFQKQHLKIQDADGRIDPRGRSLKGLLQYLCDCYTVQVVPVPAAGRLTWDAEGTEGGRYHSRRLHVPDSNSGLTVGRGYDLRKRTSTNAQRDLASAGVVSDVAFKISAAAGRWGIGASQFVIDNDLLDYQISAQTQLKLFEKVYEEKVAYLKQISDKATVTTLYGKVDWSRIDGRILDVLVDLIFRGDYTNAARNVLQKHVVNNDFWKFKAEISKRDNWATVPADRFERRKAYLEIPQCMARLQPISGAALV